MRLDNNIFTQIGLVVLVGLAAKNAILIVEFAKQREDEGMEPHVEATVEACRTRLRPILMTSFAFILGVVPLVLAKGAGAEMRVGLGVAVFSGMLGVTFFGLFFTPVFYVVIRWLTGGTPAAPRKGIPAKIFPQYLKLPLAFLLPSTASRPLDRPMLRLCRDDGTGSAWSSWSMSWSRSRSS